MKKWKEWIEVSAPLIVNFELTKSCNQACRFCHIRHDLEPFESIEKIKHILRVLKESGVFVVNYFGGEPTLYPHFSDVMKYGKEMGFTQGAVTNGTVLSNSLIENMKEYLDGVSISLHGPNKKVHESLTQMVDSFDLTIRGIKRLVESNLNPTILYTLTSQNFMYLEDTIAIAHELGVTKFDINRYIPCNNPTTDKDLVVSNKEINALAKKLEAFEREYSVEIAFGRCFSFCDVDIGFDQKLLSGCGAGVMFGAVDCFGNIKICSEFDSPIGNLFDSSLKSVWMDSPYMKYYRSFSWAPRKCFSCQRLERCNFGCKYELLSRHGGNDAPEAKISAKV